MIVLYIKDHESVHTRTKQNLFIYLCIYSLINLQIIYRTLRGRNQRKKCTLNFIKYTLGQTVLYCTAKSALFVQ